MFQKIHGLCKQEGGNPILFASPVTLLINRDKTDTAIALSGRGMCIKCVQIPVAYFFTSPTEQSTTGQLQQMIAACDDMRNYYDILVDNDGSIYPVQCRFFQRNDQ